MTEEPETSKARPEMNPEDTQSVGLPLIIRGPYKIKPIFGTIEQIKETCRFTFVHELFGGGTDLMGQFLGEPMDLPQKEVYVCTFEQPEGARQILRVPVECLSDSIYAAGHNFCDHSPASLLGLMALWPLRETPDIPTTIVALEKTLLKTERRIAMYGYGSLFGRELRAQQDAEDAQPHGHWLSVHNTGGKPPIIRHPDVEGISLDTGEIRTWNGYLIE